jgi:hypothetical protein
VPISPNTIPRAPNVTSANLLFVGGVFLIEGPADNSTQVRPFWNVGAWTGKELITYGADQQPDSMNILEPDGNLFAAGLVATAVLEGAYTVLPDFSYQEQLITSAEPIVPAGG